MADDIRTRTFFRDPNPAPDARKMGTPSAAPAAGAPPGSAAPAGAVPTGAGSGSGSGSRAESELDGDRYWVSRPDKYGIHTIYRTDGYGEDYELGRAENLGEVLNQITKPNPNTGAWYDIPKDTAISIAQKKEAGIAEHVFAMYESGRAGLANGMYWWQAMSGQMTEADALDRTNPEILKMQVDSPLKPWGYGPLKSMLSTVPWALGKVGAAVPSVLSGMEQGVKMLPATALAASAVAARGGPAGLAALATPGGVATILGASSTAGMFDFTFKVSAGSVYGDLRRKDVDPKVAKGIAPVAGVLSGLLEVVQFKYFTAAMRRTFSYKVLGNEAVKAQMTRWYVNYLKESGAEGGVEAAQQVVEEVSKNFALQMDNKADQKMTGEDIMKEAMQAGVDAFVGLGLLKLPGAVMEGAAARGGKAEVAKAEVVKKAEAPTPRKAEAPIIEAQMVASEAVPAPVADALTALNEELNPASPTAVEEYRQMGRELSTRGEDISGALIVKEEALRAEMSEILLTQDRELTPADQSRVADIQKELSLLSEFEAGMKEEALGPTEGLEPVGMLKEKPGAPAPKPITGARARVQDAVVKAREARLITELNSTLDMVKELERSRERLAKADKSTKFLDQKIGELMAQVYRIDEARAALAEKREVKPGEKLEMKQATLASITKAAFTQGRKEVVTRRAGLMNEVAAEYGLSDRDVRLLTSGRNLGAMSDLDFKKYIDDVRGKAAELSRRKQAMNELEAVRQAKEFKKESNLRRMLALPPVSKMTTEQMREYAEALEQYETGDEFWTEKRVDALSMTPWGGVATVRESIDKLAEQFSITPEAVRDLKTSWTDMFKYDTLLARTNPLYNFMVHLMQQSNIEGAAKYFEFKEKFDAYGKEAEAARKKRMTFGQKVKNFLVPMQEDLMAYLEAPTPEARAAIAAALSPEEVTLANFMADFYQNALYYLKIHNDLSSSRFEGSYVMHSRKPISEILMGIPDTGLKQAVSEIAQNWKTDDTKFAITDARTGKVLSLSKFFRQTLFRSGEMKPSQNVIRSTDIYARQFFKKQALDKSIPIVDTAVMALRADAIGRGEMAQGVAQQISEFTKKYVNAQKGQAAFPWIPQGSQGDATIRFMTHLTSMWHMGLNIPIQIASEVGATAAKIPALGVGGIAKARYRRMTKQGKKVLEKYKSFTGEGVLEEMGRPGQPLEERLGLIAYGLFAWSRKVTMQDILLANMTEAEFRAGEISPKRLAEIKVVTGRWIDVGGLKSVFGRTSVGGNYIQFKAWAVPMALSTVDLGKRLAAELAGHKGALTPMHRTELLRMAQMAALVALAWGLSGEVDDKDESYIGKIKFYAHREVGTFIQALDPTMYLAGSASLGWITRIVQSLTLMTVAIATGKRTKEGDVPGVKGLKRAATPALIRPLVRGREEKKQKRMTPYKSMGRD